jgi:hypothetical protein
VLIHPNFDLALRSNHAFFQTDTGSPHFFEYGLVAFKHVFEYVKHLLLAKLLEVAQPAIDTFRLDRIMSTGQTSE